MTVTLTPVDGGTEVRLVHDGLTEEQAVRHAEGWNHDLDTSGGCGHRGDAGPDEWAAAADPLNELSSAEATLAVLQNVLRVRMTPICPSRRRAPNTTSHNWPTI